tara:strand:- start:834 stop:1148 length:315 start_codon:yes stop_codon:yes gene_type:complete
MDRQETFIIDAIMRLFDEADYVSVTSFERGCFRHTKAMLEMSEGETIYCVLSRPDDGSESIRFGVGTHQDQMLEFQPSSEESAQRISSLLYSEVNSFYKPKVIN